MDTKHNSISGLGFPFDQTALNALEEYKSNASDYVQLAIGSLGASAIET